MEEISPLVKLDHVLRTTLQFNGKFGFGVLLDMLLSESPKIIEDDKELVQVLKKLEDDKYLEYSYKKHTTGVDRNDAFRLLFDGKYFIKKGGYSQVAISVDSENERVKSLEIQSERQSKQLVSLHEDMVDLTKWIAVGTIALLLATLVYYCLDLYYSYYQAFPCK